MKTFSKNSPKSLNAQIPQALEDKEDSENLSVENTDLSQTDIRNKTLIKCEFLNVRFAEKLNRIKALECVFSNCDFNSSDLSCRSLIFRNRTVIVFSRFFTCDLSGCDLTYTNARSVHFHGSNLNNSNLSYIDLEEASFTNCILSGVNLTGANVFGADFSKTSLPYHVFTQTDFSNAKLGLRNWLKYKVATSLITSTIKRPLTQAS